MENITDEEKKAMEELKSRTINDLTPTLLEDDTLFYRFSKARDFNVVEAESMLRKHLEWRKEFEIDAILTKHEPPDVLLKYGASSFVCFDKGGCVVRLQDWGHADWKGLCNSVTKQEMAKYWFYLAEKDKQMIFSRGGNMKTPIFCLIYDLKDLTYSNAVNVNTLQYLLYGVKLLIDNFPENVRCINIINAPFYFAFIYAVLKPILPTALSQKLRVYSTDDWKEALLNDIDADILPAYLGGNKTDPDGNPLCESLIQHGKTIPKSYYKQNERKKLVLLPDTKTITVKPLSKNEISLEIKEENSYLQWEFEMKKGDIDFYLQFEGESLKIMEQEELIPRQRINTSFESEKGYFKCQKVGKYTIVFDNSFSWIQSKEIYHRIEVRHARERLTARVNMT